MDLFYAKEQALQKIEFVFNQIVNILAVHIFPSVYLMDILDVQ